jgi:hypothetical protein
MSELIEERLVLERFGLGLKDSMRIRKEFSRGVDWILTKEQGVLWTEAGIARLAKAIDCPVPVLEKKEEDGPVAVRAVKTDWPNKHLILAEAPGGRKVRVRVRDSAFYVPSMVFQARRVSDDLFEAIKPPRARGVV